MPFTGKNHNKNNSWKTFLPTQTDKEVTLVFNILELLQYSIFPKLKSDETDVILRTEDLDVLRATRLDLCPHTAGTGDRVRVVFDGR